MSFSDFVMYFDSITICRVRDGWAEARSRVTVPSARAGMRVVAAHMTPLASGEVDVVITQPGKRGGGIHQTFLDPGFLVIKTTGAGVGKLVASVAAGPCNNESSTIASVFLDATGGGGGGGGCAAGVGAGAGAGAGGYLIVPLSLRATSHLASDGRVMVVAAHSSTPVLLKEVELNHEQFGAAIMAEARRSGKCEITSMGLKVYRLSYQSGYIFVAANNGMVAMSVSLNVTSENMISSRESMTIKDTIYPGRGQIIGVLAQAGESVGHSISYRFAITPSMPFMAAIHEPSLLENSIHTPFPIQRE
jgi:hypothetical protein